MWPFKKKEAPYTPAQVAQIWRECWERSRREDELFDEYLQLPNRPRPIEMVRLTETSDLEPMESFDMDHWRAWYENKLAETNQ